MFTARVLGLGGSCLLLLINSSGCAPASPPISSGASGVSQGARQSAAPGASTAAPTTLQDASVQDSAPQRGLATHATAAAESDAVNNELLEPGQEPEPLSGAACFSEVFYEESASAFFGADTQRPYDDQLPQLDLQYVRKERHCGVGEVDACLWLAEEHPEHNFTPLTIISASTRSACVPYFRDRSCKLADGDAMDAALLEACVSSGAERFAANDAETAAARWSRACKEGHQDACDWAQLVAAPPLTRSAVAAWVARFQPAASALLARLRADDALQAPTAFTQALVASLAERGDFQAGLLSTEIEDIEGLRAFVSKNLESCRADLPACRAAIAPGAWSKNYVVSQLLCEAGDDWGCHILGVLVPATLVGYLEPHLRAEYFHQTMSKACGRGDALSCALWAVTPQQYGGLADAESDKAAALLEQACGKADCFELSAPQLQPMPEGLFPQGYVDERFAELAGAACIVSGKYCSLSEQQGQIAFSFPLKDAAARACQGGSIDACMLHVVTPAASGAQSHSTQLKARCEQSSGLTQQQRVAACLAVAVAEPPSRPALRSICDAGHPLCLTYAPALLDDHPQLYDDYLARACRAELVAACWQLAASYRYRERPDEAKADMYDAMAEDIAEPASTPQLPSWMRWLPPRDDR